MKRIKIISERGVGAGTRFVDVETGLDIKGVASFSVSCQGVDELVFADLRLVLVEVETEARARFLAEYSDPDGRKRLREISKIIWADGGSTDFD